MMNRSLSIFILAMLPAISSLGYLYWTLFLRDFLAEDVSPFADHWIDWIALLLMHMFHHPERKVTAWVALVDAETGGEYDQFQITFITTCNSLYAVERHAENEFELKTDYHQSHPDAEIHVISMELPYYLHWEIPNEQGLDYRYPVWSMKEEEEEDIEFE